MKNTGKTEEKGCEELNGVPVYFFDTVISTMDVAEEFFKEGKTGIVVAKQQEKGRGRYGKRWYSPEGGLYFSWILKGEPLYPLFLLEILSLSVAETLKYFGIDCRIKLPNDIITNGKKIAGILIVKKGDCYITGIGININNTLEDKTLQVSVRDIIGKDIAEKRVLKKFINIFLQYKQGLYIKPDKHFKQWSEYLIK
ncbi:MAG: biotin--[acetyl-CoA-carboxylase] ligase [Candidatus Ratteibacteria bacterium]